MKQAVMHLSFAAIRELLLLPDNVEIVSAHPSDSWNGLVLKVRGEGLPGWKDEYEYCEHFPCERSHHLSRVSPRYKSMAAVTVEDEPRKVWHREFVDMGGAQ